MNLPTSQSDRLTSTTIKSLPGVFSGYQAVSSSTLIEPGLAVGSPYTFDQSLLLIGCSSDCDMITFSRFVVIVVGLQGTTACRAKELNHARRMRLFEIPDLTLALGTRFTVDLAFGYTGPPQRFDRLFGRRCGVNQSQRTTPKLPPSDHLLISVALRNGQRLHCTKMLLVRPALTSASFATTSASLRCTSRRRVLRSYSTATNPSQLATLYPLSDIAKAELNSTSPYDEHISVLTLNRAPAKNAISRALLSEMDQHISSLLVSANVRTLLIRSSVPGAFCAGADLKERKGMSKSEVDAFLLGLRRVFTNVSRLPMPTIACLDGLAMGGGLELALTCDLRIAGPAATKLGLTETKLGIIPGAGGTSRMTRLVGPAKAKELIFSAKLVDAVEASRIGFVDMVAQEGDGNAAFHRGVQLARSFAKNGKSKSRGMIPHRKSE